MIDDAARNLVAVWRENREDFLAGDTTPEQDRELFWLLDALVEAEDA